MQEIKNEIRPILERTGEEPKSEQEELKKKYYIRELSELKRSNPAVTKYPRYLAFEFAEICSQIETWVKILSKKPKFRQEVVWSTGGQERTITRGDIASVILGLTETLYAQSYRCGRENVNAGMGYKLLEDLSRQEHARDMFVSPIIFIKNSELTSSSFGGSDTIRMITTDKVINLLSKHKMNLKLHKVEQLQNGNKIEYKDSTFLYEGKLLSYWNGGDEEEEELYELFKRERGIINEIPEGQPTLSQPSTGSQGTEVVEVEEVTKKDIEQKTDNERKEKLSAKLYQLELNPIFSYGMGSFGHFVSGIRKKAKEEKIRLDDSELAFLYLLGQEKDKATYKSEMLAEKLYVTKLYEKNRGEFDTKITKALAKFQKLQVIKAYKLTHTKRGSRQFIDKIIVEK